MTLAVFVPAAPGGQGHHGRRLCLWWAVEGVSGPGRRGPGLRLSPPVSEGPRAVPVGVGECSVPPRRTAWDLTQISSAHGLLSFIVPAPSKYTLCGLAYRGLMFCAGSGGAGQPPASSGRSRGLCVPTMLEGGREGSPGGQEQPPASAGEGWTRSWGGWRKSVSRRGVCRRGSQLPSGPCRVSPENLVPRELSQFWELGAPTQPSTWAAPLCTCHSPGITHPHPEPLSPYKVTGTQPHPCPYC